MILGLLACHADPLPPLRQEAYVWQRVWSPAVEQAVAGSDFDALTVLAAEISWSDGAPSITEIALPTLPAGTTLAIRSAVPADDPAPLLAPLIDALLSAHPEAAAVQLDIDLPTARLPEYAGWVTRLSAGCPVPVEITALPTWLSSPAMADLAGAAARVVLQVHWLDPSDPDHLLDPDALDHLAALSRLDRPLSAALPAYGYQLARDDDGGLAGIVAEQGSLIGGEEVMADPVAVARLVAALEVDRPEHLTGLHWFRLPVDGDLRAWPLQTLRAVRQGRPPITDAALTTADDGGALTLTLTNTGEARLLPPAVLVDGSILAADGLGGWRWSAGASRLLPEHAAPLQPGESVVVGWLRPLSEAPTLRLSPPTSDR